MKLKLKSVIILSIVALTIIFFMLNKKEIIITGFVRSSDSIVITHSGVASRAFERDCNNNKEGLCSFNEKVKLNSFWNDEEFKIRVDSANSILLDTSVTISKNNKKPIISFQDPNETAFKRTVFVIDEADEKIIIP